MIDSETSAALFFVACLLGLAGLYLFALRRQQTALTSGTEIARFEVPPGQEPMSASQWFRISEADRWCRVSADFAMTESAWESKSIFAKFPDFREFHRFAIRISDSNGTIVIDETGSFYDFLGFAGARGKMKLSLPFRGERSECSRSGQVALLEFVPFAGGSYKLDFEFLSDGNFAGDYFRREAKFEKFVLSIREGVIPLEQAAYRHRRVTLSR